MSRKRKSAFAEPGLVIPVRAYVRPDPNTTMFRLLVTDVWPQEATLLESALRTIETIDWRGFEYAEDREVLEAFGFLPLPAALAVETFLRLLTFCAWDLASDEIGQSEPGWHPYVRLQIHPETPDETTFQLNSRHYGQYKRRRRAFEEAGGNVLERWGLGH